MDVKPKNPAAQPARRMDGLGPTGQPQAEGAPLDLRKAKPKPVQAVAPKQAEVIKPVKKVKPAPAFHDDPLQDLLESDSASPQIASAPKKKSGFWAAFWKSMIVLVVLAFLASIGLFIYFTYYRVQ